MCDIQAMYVLVLHISHIGAGFNQWFEYNHLNNPTYLTNRSWLNLLCNGKQGMLIMGLRLCLKQTSGNGNFCFWVCWNRWAWEEWIKPFTEFFRDCITFRLFCLYKVFIPSDNTLKKILKTNYGCNVIRHQLLTRLFL